MTIIEHIHELRTRLIRCLMVVTGTSVISLFFAKKIFAVLQAPMLKVLPPSQSFIATSPFEAYVIYLKTALLTGVFSAAPFIFYQLLSFITPALTKKEQRLLLPMSCTAGVLFVAGALFGYFVVFPMGFYYINLLLLDTAIQFLPRISEYFSLVVMLLLVFGLTFDLPIVMLILGKLGILKHGQIKPYRRYVIVLAFIVAAILTPGPDIISQLFLALPLCLLYELGGLLLRFTETNNGKNVTGQ